MEANLTLALKLFAQGVEKAEHNQPIPGFRFWGLIWHYFNNPVTAGAAYTNYRQELDDFETLLLDANASQNWHHLFEHQFYSNNGTKQIPRLPQKVSFNDMASVVPPTGLKAGNRTLDFILYHEYLRFAVSRTIWGDSVESDTFI